MYQLGSVAERYEQIIMTYLYYIFHRHSRSYLSHELTLRRSPMNMRINVVILIEVLLIIPYSLLYLNCDHVSATESVRYLENSMYCIYIT